VGAADPRVRRHLAARALRIFVTFQLVCLIWVFFRADGIAAAWTYLSGLAGAWQAPAAPLATAAAVYLGLTLLVDWPCWRRDAELPIASGWPPWARAAAYAAMLLAISFVGEGNVRPFIYFQF
jgi:hypothetical protein